MNILELIILYVARYIISFPLAVSIVRYKILTIHLTIIAWYIFWGAIIEAASTTLALQGINNLWLSHIYAVEEFTVISLFFWCVLNEIISKKIIYTVIGLFIVFAIINVIYFEPLNVYPSNIRTVGSIIIVFYTLTAIYLRFKYDTHKKGINNWYFHLNKVSLFFIFMGLLLFYSGGTILVSIGNQLTNPIYGDKYLDINRVVWAGYRILVIILYTFIGIGLLLFKPPKINNPIEDWEIEADKLEDKEN